MYNPLLKVTTTCMSLPGYNVNKFGEKAVNKSSDQDDESLSVSSLFIGFAKLNSKNHDVYNPTKCSYSRKECSQFDHSVSVILSRMEDLNITHCIPVPN